MGKFQRFLNKIFGVKNVLLPHFIYCYSHHSQGKKCSQSYSGLYLSRILPHSDLIRRDTVRIFPAFSLIRTEYGEILRMSPCSVRMRKNAGKMWTRRTSNMDTFYAVISTTFPPLNVLL